MHEILVQKLFSLPEWMVEGLDEIKKERILKGERVSRSSLLRDAVKEFLEKRGEIIPGTENSHCQWVNGNSH